MKNKLLIILIYINYSYSFNFNKIIINNKNKIAAINNLPIKKIPDPNIYINKYWYDNRIHNFGNIGIYGFIHALLSPFATYIIDYLSYNKINVRKEILDKIPENDTILDMCCGTGFSTRDGDIGIDTSKEMLNIANLIKTNTNTTFVYANAENYGEKKSNDVVTIFFSTHEMPSNARRKIIKNALNIAKKNVLIMDIDPYNFANVLLKKYKKGEPFLSGEPFILNYLIDMNSDINNCLLSTYYTWNLEKHSIIDNHVVLWNFTKNF